MSDQKPKKKKRQYKSAETRARQLAGLANVKIEDHVMGVQVEKINGKGLFAGVSEDQRKQILELYCQGHGSPYIADKVGVSYNTVNEVRQYFLDYDSQFRNSYFTANLKGKMQTLIDSSMNRVQETVHEMTPKDAVLTMGIALDKYIALEKSKSPEQLHQHVHLHANTEINDQFMQALKPK
ncbi:hypothetical protein UFOVP742_18 [uncultured Caudovirales phage]|uniref:Homeodomain-like domain containing protein n=1 Tax=uncultured Caudovirales phage TaxID=2100421 RepID=A0A6J7X2C5_9CAUD|nr:hypothetical protein UFOVP742_18 [uncultured Caudovirales phage]